MSKRLDEAVLRNRRRLFIESMRAQGLEIALEDFLNEEESQRFIRRVRQLTREIDCWKPVEESFESIRSGMLQCRETIYNTPDRIGVLAPGANGTGAIRLPVTSFFENIECILRNFQPPFMEVLVFADEELDFGLMLYYGEYCKELACW